MPYEFYAPTRVLFGAGQLDRLHFQTMPGRKAMVVLSNGSSARKSGALDRCWNSSGSRVWKRPSSTGSSQPPQVHRRSRRAFRPEKRL